MTCKNQQLSSGWDHVRLLGASLIVAGGNCFSFGSAHFLGYGFALLCTITWSGYSVL